MNDEEIAGNLVYGHRNGARNLWIGGGEPTIHKKLTMLIRLAIKTGYRRIKIQSNGMMFSYREFCEKCLEAGATEFNVSIKGKNAEDHDWMTRVKGSHAAMVKGIENLKQLGARVEGDILITAKTVPFLTEIVREFHSIGVDGFDFWYLSLRDAADGGARELLPSLETVGPAMLEALSAGRALGISHLANYHVPACFLPGCEKYCVPAASLRLLVCNPGGYRFMLEESPMEKGVFLDGCDGCKWLGSCPGFRQEYIEIFGTDGFPPKKFHSSRSGKKRTPRERR
ncbi:MAG: radical SAM protein [bacterium]